MKTTADDRVWRRLRAKVKDVNKRIVKVGILSGEAYEDGTTIAEVGAFHEYGSADGRLPERSWMRRTFIEQRQKHIRLLADLARNILSERMSPDKALGVLGSWAVTAIRTTIRQNIPPALKPETIRRKTVGGKQGFIALIDTARLWNSITWALGSRSGSGT
jgi:hypothetical protein